MSAATFQYRVRDSLGNFLEGTLDAATADDAAQQLRRDGFHVVELSEGGDDEGVVSPAGPTVGGRVRDESTGGDGRYGRHAFGRART